MPHFSLSVTRLCGNLLWHAEALECGKAAAEGAIAFDDAD